MISGPKIQGEWKIQLRIAIKFFSSKNSKSNHIEKCIQKVITLKS